MSDGDRAHTGMSERQPYTYVVLRYRHDPLAGEFANVGVVLHAPRGRFLGAKLRTTAGGRLTRMFPTIDNAAFRDGLKSIRRAVDTLAAGDGGGLLSGLGDASAFARRALPTDDSSFVWGPLGSGLTADPAQTLAKLYGRFVTQYDPKSKLPVREDADVWRPVHNLLVERQIADLLQPKIIRSPVVAQVAFDHAWKNGAWHVYQPLSFDLASEESISEKAAKWTGHLVGLKKADETVKAHLVIGSPSDVALMDAYRRALNLLRLPEQDAEVVEESEVEGLVDRIEEAVKSHAIAG
jgi:hypothetical protein